MTYREVTHAGERQSRSGFPLLADVTNLPILLGIALTMGCAASQSTPKVAAGGGPLYAFLVEAVARSESTGYAEGEKHVAIVVVTANSFVRAGQIVTETMAERGWHVFKVRESRTGDFSPDAREYPVFAAAIEAARSGKTAIVIFSVPIEDKR